MIFLVRPGTVAVDHQQRHVVVGRVADISDHLVAEPAGQGAGSGAARTAAQPARGKKAPALFRASLTP